MNYEEVLRSLENRGVVPTKIPSLEPMKKALTRSGLLEKISPEKVIIVAGTNGKGTTSATLSTLLCHQGKSVGLYTSPHLITTTERFRINDQDITSEEFVLAYEALLPLIEEESLSHFEALTLMAVWLFYSGKTRIPVEYAIFEVGMGGTWDATNAIPHHFCAITKLGVDHQFFLGKTLTEIAAQKFGIIEKNSKVTCSPLDPSLSALRIKTEKEKEVTFTELPPYELEGLDHLKTPWGNTEMGLWGARAAENSVHALTIFQALGFHPEEHLEALKEVRWPGRFQKTTWPKMNCPLYLSGDHNEQGVLSLLEILKQMSWKNLHLVVGIGADKDLEMMLAHLNKLPNIKLYLTETTLKPLQVKDYPEKWKDKASLIDKDVEAILNDIAVSSHQDDIVLVTGSLYLVGKVLELKKNSYHH